MGTIKKITYLGNHESLFGALPSTEISYGHNFGANNGKPKEIISESIISQSGHLCLVLLKKKQS